MEEGFRRKDTNSGMAAPAACGWWRKGSGQGLTAVALCTRPPPGIPIMAVRKSGGCGRQDRPLVKASSSSLISFLGNEQMKVENFKSAVSYYGKAIELNPSNAVYYCNR